MPFTEDMTVYTDTSMFGSVALYTPFGASVESEVDGIFDREYEEAVGIEGSAPVFGCAAADVPNARHGDTLTVDGDDWVVRGVQPDGTGWVRLILELADA